MPTRSPRKTRVRVRTKARVSLENEHLVVSESTFVDGQLGVIAKRPFKKGEVLFDVKGPVKKKPTKYTLSAGLDEHVDPRHEDGRASFGHYTNHSCNPTTFVRVVRRKGKDPYLEIVARRAIKKGEELTFDYATLEYEVTINGSTCDCGHKVCRGVIHGFKDMPHHVVEKYKKEGVIPQHLLKIRGY